MTSTPCIQGFTCSPVACWRGLALPRSPAVSPVALIAVTAFALALHASEFVTLPREPLGEHFKVAAQLNAGYPHAIWFPQNPLITY